MTTNQDHETGRPSHKERLSKGPEFHVRITEGGRVTLDLTMDAEMRVVRAFAIDDERLREMLIVSSVVAGHVEGVCMRRAVSESPGLPVSESLTEGRAEA